LLPLAALAAVTAAVLLLGEVAPAQQKGGKRPLTHSDYDGWKAIQGAQISADGRFVAYTLTPQEGDAELVVKDLQTGKEFRHGRGATPAAGAAVKGLPTPEGPATGARVVFTGDIKFVVFSIAPTKAEQTAAKKGGGEAPKNKLGILNLATGKVEVVPGVRSFQVPEDTGAGVVYQKYAAKAAAAGKDGATPDGEDDFQKSKGGPKKSAEPKETPPAEVVVRNLVAGTESTIADVTDYTIARDGSVLVVILAGKDAENVGVFGYYPAGKDQPGKLARQAILSGKARYSRLTWDERQRFLAFFADRSPEGKTQTDVSLYVADREAKVVNAKAKEGEPAPQVAVELVNTRTPGFKDGLVLAERAAPSFSNDGMHLFFGVAPPVPDATGKEPAKDKAVVELWHWNDDYIVPMQKVRAAQEKNRTYRAVVHLADRKVVQLADKSVPDVVPSPTGLFALGFDERPYRRLIAYDQSYSDWFLIDTATGARKQLATKHHWGLAWSPLGRYAVFFDGKDWNTVSTPDGLITNITKGLPVKLSNEENDLPSAPAPYGIAGWTPDEYFALVYDKYDVWKVAAAGGGQELLTRGVGREAKVQFRYVKLEPKQKTIDLTKPLLLRLESLTTRDTGFARLDPRGVPEKLIMQARNFGMPTMARNTDTFLLTVSTFHDYPDLYVTGPSFQILSRVSNANPQQSQILWGRSELIHYQNADGVPLTGVLIKPDNFDPSKKYPMIVYIYEKLSQNLHRFVDPQPGTSINPSYYASNGYLVLMPDITYTVGYPGQSALKCVLPAIQAVADRGFLKEDAIGIQGHSWGGYQVAYLVTQTPRFKAAAAGAPVGNMTSAYGGIRWGTGLPRQFQYEKTQSRIGGTLWEFPQRYIENSPVFMADRVKTPLMILHNDQDEAVPWQQGIELYLALRRLGKEAYLFNYPGEGHGLRKRVDQMDYTTRMQEFFDHHLRGAPQPAWMASGIPYTPPPSAKETSPPGQDD
jgi:dienelactone hydrolase